MEEVNIANNNNNNNITELEYLNLANESLLKYKAMNLIIKKQRKQIIELRKHLYSAYGLSRILDNMISELDLPPSIKTIYEFLINITRAELSIAINGDDEESDEDE